MFWAEGSLHFLWRAFGGARRCTFKEVDMPSKTRKQARTMAAAAHNPAFAKKVGIPQKVAQDFNQADAGTGILSGPRPTAKQARRGYSKMGGMS